MGDLWVVIFTKASQNLDQFSNLLNALQYFLTFTLWKVKIPSSLNSDIYYLFLFYSTLAICSFFPLICNCHLILCNVLHGAEVVTRKQFESFLRLIYFFLYFFPPGLYRSISTELHLPFWVHLLPSMFLCGTSEWLSLFSLEFAEMGSNFVTIISTSNPYPGLLPVPFSSSEEKSSQHTCFW